MANGPLPNDLNAEAAVISTMMLDASAIDRLMMHGFLAEHCYADANRIIVESIYELYQVGTVIDLVTLVNTLRGKNRLEFVGGVGYVAQVVDATPAVANVLEHASIVTEKWRLRRAIQACQLAVAKGYEPIENTQEYLEELEVQIAEITHAGRRVTLEPVGGVLVREVGRIAEVKQGGKGEISIATGFTEIDRLTGGLFRGNVYIVGARPGMGKTAFFTSLCASICRPRPHRGGGFDPGYAGCFFSLEMPRAQMATRFAVHETGIAFSSITSGTVHGQDWPKLIQAANDIKPWPIWIDDSPALSLGELRAMIRQFKRRVASGAIEEPNNGEVGIVAVDYLQLMKGARERGASREEEIASLSRGLKVIAKEEDVPIVVASQLNRNVEREKDKRPTLSDLRESGSIEQDADAVFFLYRDFYYDKQAERREAEVIIAKQRNGPTATVMLTYQDTHMRFYNPAAGEDDFYQDDYWNNQ